MGGGRVQQQGWRGRDSVVVWAFEAVVVVKVVIVSPAISQLDVDDLSFGRVVCGAVVQRRRCREGEREGEGFAWQFRSKSPSANFCKLGRNLDCRDSEPLVACGSLSSKVEFLTDWCYY